jgi:trk system potassium uptake protein TrkA
VDRAVSPGQVTGDAVLQLTTGVEDVVTLRDDRVELLDFVAREKAKIIGKSIARELPADAIVGMILRNGELIAPEEGRIKEGDHVFVLALRPVVSKVKKLFAA